MYWHRNRSRKGSALSFEQATKQGFVKVRVDGEVQDISKGGMQDWPL